MKIQRNIAYKYKNKEHYKHVVVIPNSVIKELGWDSNTELRPVIQGSDLMLKKKAK